MVNSLIALSLYSFDFVENSVFAYTSQKYNRTVLKEEKFVQYRFTIMLLVVHRMKCD